MPPLAATADEAVSTSVAIDAANARSSSRFRSMVPTQLPQKRRRPKEGGDDVGQCNGTIAFGEVSNLNIVSESQQKQGFLRSGAATGLGPISSPSRSAVVPRACEVATLGACLSLTRLRQRFARSIPLSTLAW